MVRSAPPITLLFNQSAGMVFRVMIALSRCRQAQEMVFSSLHPHAFFHYCPEIHPQAVFMSSSAKVHGLCPAGPRPCELSYPDCWAFAHPTAWRWIGSWGGLSRGRRRRVDVFAVDVLGLANESSALFATCIALLEAVKLEFCLQLFYQAHAEIAKGGECKESCLLSKSVENAVFRWEERRHPIVQGQSR